LETEINLETSVSILNVSLNLETDLLAGNFAFDMETKNVLKITILVPDIE